MILHYVKHLFYIYVPLFKKNLKTRLIVMLLFAHLRIKQSSCKNIFWIATLPKFQTKMRVQWEKPVRLPSFIKYKI